MHTPLCIFLWQASSGMNDIIARSWPLLLIFVVFYFFIIRPQSKKTKDQQTFTQALQKGDDVVTASGIFGKINKIEEGIVTLQVDTKTFIRVTKSAISKELTEASSPASS